MKYYTLNAFAKSPEGGNPAGVVFNSENLSNQTKQEIAKRIGFSETAFVEKSTKADFKLQFFTPSEEVDLCGHATIASFFLMLNLSRIGIGSYTQETKAGVLKVDVMKNGSVFMEQTKPEFFELLPKEEIADSLNVSPKLISSDLPIQIVSTGLKDIFIPINNLANLLEIKVDFEKVAAISKKYNAIGYHLFSLETLNKASAHCRNFAPRYNIPEEAATGTASGALSCYLVKYGIITTEQASALVFEQGHTMGKPSEIQTQLLLKNNAIVQVKVGGMASNIKEHEL